MIPPLFHPTKATVHHLHAKIYKNVKLKQLIRMKGNTRVFIYAVAGVLFLTSFVEMLIYGYKTFYIESDTNKQQDYKYHFALIAEETENDYWRLIEKGAKKAAMENNIQLE